MTLLSETESTGFGTEDDAEVDVWGNERWTRVPILPDSTCLMFFGKRGSGKSAVMAKMGKDEAQMGRKVWYWPPDYRFKYGEPIDLLTLSSMPDWLRDGALLLDEMQVLASNLRTIATSNQMIGSVMQQLRKRGLNVYGTSNQPGRIDATIALQTDFHYNCFRMEDPRCKKHGHHISSCDDHIRMRWVDTNGNYGYDKRYKDGRKRGRTVVWKIRDVYATYNTGAIADLADVMAIDKNKILNHKSDANAGLPFAELVKELRNTWIPWLVADQGTRMATPANLALSINEQFGYNIETRLMGRALSELGLQAERSNRGRIATLPPPEYLETWMRDGTWPRD